MKRMISLDAASGGLIVGEFEDSQALAVETALKKVANDRDQVVADLAAHRTASKKAFAAKDAIVAEKDRTIKAKDAEIAKLTAELKAAKAVDIDALIDERSKLIADAKKLAPEAELKGNADQIRKAAITAACAADSTGASSAVVTAIVGADGIEKANDVQTKGAFVALVGLAKRNAIDAQNDRINAALGAGNNSTVGNFVGPVERIGGGDAFKARQ